MKGNKTDTRKEIAAATQAWVESGKKITACPARKARGHYQRKIKNTAYQAVDMSALPSSLKIRFGFK